MYVIGTAGHVDHGKSTLIQALTGIDPDHLPQEKERGMTIDLGFAWLSLPSGKEVSIVDMPGHERFVKNMLAGVGGIDVALLVIAADEGVMPQTREHLAILDLLHIRRGLVVITKTDLVDEEMLELVSADVGGVLQGTSFEGAPSLAVSSVNGQGLEELKASLDKMLGTIEPRRDLGRPRLPIDRSFTVAGFGTVVTGTLVDGSLKLGQEVELAMTSQRCRIRGLQSHRKKLQEATPGRRLAINLSGVSCKEIRRGEVITTPGWLKPTAIVDAHIRLIADIPKGLKHNRGVTFHAFTAETLARVRLLDREDLEPGEEGWVQIHLKEPVPLVKGDFFVIRSAEATLGGGKVVDASPRRHRRFVLPVIERLTLMEEGTDDDLVSSAVEHWGPCTLKTLAQRANLSLADVASRIDPLASAGQVVLLSDASNPEAVAYPYSLWQQLRRKAQSVLKSYHGEHPLRSAAPREEMRSRLGLSPQIFNRALPKLASEGVLMEEGPGVRLPQHAVALSTVQRKEAEEYVTHLQANPFSPPTDRAIAPELLNVLVEEGKVVKASDSMVFHAEAYREMVDRIVQQLREQGKITVAAVRDMFNTSRKYVMPLMDYLDQQHITRRVGDERVLLHDPEKRPIGE